MREMCGLQDTLHPPKFAVSNCLNCYLFAKFLLFSHATFCAPCAKAKAACKPFDADKVRAKAKAETVRRSKARKVKQQTDAEWKTEVLQKLEGLDELSGLRKDVQRIAVALEKLAGIEGQDSDKALLSWLESKGELTEIQGGKEKRKAEGGEVRRKG